MQRSRFEISDLSQTIIGRRKRKMKTQYRGKKQHGRVLRWIVAVVIVVLLYLGIGAVAPFFGYESMESDYKFEMQRFYQDNLGVDRAMLMETNRSAWEERIRLFHQAKKRIILSTFDMREGESTKDLLAVLLQKADEGVFIQILVDGVSGMIRMEGKDLFYAISSHPNIEIKIYNPLNLLEPWKTQGRMHDKYVIVDNLAYILGGRNTMDYFIGDYETDGKSYDREVFVYNTKFQSPDTAESSLFEVESYFHAMWEKEECQYFHEDNTLQEKDGVKQARQMLRQRYSEIVASVPQLCQPFDYETVTVETNQIVLMHNPTGLYEKQPTVFYELTELMKQAKERVLIHTPYIVCNSWMYERLKEVKEAVGTVTMMINAVENGDNVMASSDYLWNKKNVVETGIQIYEYNGGISYHGKSMVVDDLAIVGSYNMDLRSTYVDTELMLAVQSRELSDQLVQNMRTLEHDSKKVLDADEYEVPEHLTVTKLPVWKQLLLRVIGIIMQPQPLRILV